MAGCEWSDRRDQWPDEVALPAGLAPPVPAGGGAVCHHCHGPAALAGGPCYCCALLCARLGTLTPVVPVAACAVPGPLHSLLRGYKDHGDPGRRRWCAERVGAVLGRFLAAHRRCLDAVAGRPLEATVLVPPGRPRVGQPLDGVLAAIGSQAERSLPPVVRALERTAGTAAPAHLRADPGAYNATVDGAHRIRGRAVLLLDDSLTTGASAQSAAAVLRTAGARAVVILVVGRVVRPRASPAQRRYWAQVCESLDHPGQPVPCAAGPRCLVSPRQPAGSAPVPARGRSAPR